MESHAAEKLNELLRAKILTESDNQLAKISLRRICHPLRLTVFGAEVSQAVQLLNLMIGRPVLPSHPTRANFQFVYSKESFANLEFRDGSRKKLSSKDFRSIFDDRPTRVRIGVDLPVLKKITFKVIAGGNVAKLCGEKGSHLFASDILVWAGSRTHERLIDLWSHCPETLRAHSYLVLPPEGDPKPWLPFSAELHETLTVDAISALAAKNADGGSDVEAFRLAGGAELVRTIKHEIDVLRRTAEDAAEVLFARYENHLPKSQNSEPTMRVKSVVRARRLRRESRAAFAPREFSKIIKNMDAEQSREDATKLQKYKTATPWSLGIK